MFSIDFWKEIFQTIGKNKLRTFLSGFTVALGIFIFIGLFGMGNGLKNTFQEFFLDDANNLLFIYPGQTSKPYKGYKSNRRIEFTNEDYEEIKENFAPLLEYASPRITRNPVVKYKNEFDNYSLRAVAPDHQTAEKTILMEGRYINLKDIKNNAKVVVIGRLVARDLFKNENPIGKYVDINDSNFKVVGVFQDSSGDNEERRIYAPYSTWQQLEKNNDKIGMMLFAFKPSLGVAGSLQLQNKIDTFLKDKKSIDPTDNNGLFIRNIADDLARNQLFVGILQLIVSFVGIGTLIAGIIGISNIMVFIVKERTKEIGIRKAIGATPSSITVMILSESIFITTVSGYVGMFGGILMLENLGTTLKEYFIKNPYVDASTAFVATVILILFGALAGYIPARRASRIKPIIALRDE